MKKNKGFTIIELLTVIVLLGIIATISYVSIGSGMGKSKEKLYKQQIVTLENAGRNWVIKNSGLVDSSYDVTGCKDNTCFTNNGKHYYKLSYYQLFKDGYIKSKDLKNPKNEERMPGCIGIRYNGDINQYEVNYIEECVNLVSEVDDTQKSYNKSIRVVYMDPTNLYNKCDAKEETKNRNANGTPTEIKSGCMKWYAYYDDGKNTKMILDHNTTAKIAFTSTNSDDMVNEINKRLEHDTENWKVNEKDANKITAISVIEAEEIADAVGYSSWTPNMGDSGNFYLSTRNTKAPTNFTATNTSAYAWLYNNMYKCKVSNMGYFGCTIEDNTYGYSIFKLSDNDYTTINGSDSAITGYWTKTGQNNNVWVMQDNGRIFNRSYLADDYAGIRPVVTIPSSMIN